tara:strand:+ start:2232 stop:2468 length:237 start_codon:yes stop_codon:yes gene_type:complete
MRWSLKKRRMWYKLSGMPVWLHTHCVNKKTELPLFKDKFWVEGWKCKDCNMTITEQDEFNRKILGEYTINVLDPKAYM